MEQNKKKNSFDYNKLHYVKIKSVRFLSNRHTLLKVYSVLIAEHELPGCT